MSCSYKLMPNRVKLKYLFNNCNSAGTSVKVFSDNSTAIEPFGVCKPDCTACVVLNDMTLRLSLKSMQLNKFQLSLMSLFTLVLCPLWQFKRSSVKNVCVAQCLTFFTIYLLFEHWVNFLNKYKKELMSEIKVFFFKRR